MTLVARARAGAKALGALGLLALSACATGPFPEAPEPVGSAPGAPAAPGSGDIDLSAYRVTFEDEFDRLDVSGWRCDSRWIAHTPWNGDFGAAAFADPSRDFPFVARDGVLRIEARREPGGRWASGLMASWNTCGEGFAQQYGYFEIRAQLPAGSGFWPAFWLIGVDRSRYTAEIDVFEHHTIRPERFSSTIHVHPRADGVERVNESTLRAVAPGALSDGFNTYGVDVSPEMLVFYFNRREFWRTPTPPEFHQPFYILFNLAMDEGEITQATPPVDYMYVDYVRVFERQ